MSIEHKGLKYLTRIFLIGMSIICGSSATKSHEDVCPNMCHCDLYMGMNRANCSSRHVINANINMPKQVEILDLSNNDITVLDNNCFSSLEHLTTLTLTNNSIHSIDLDAFAKLPKLTHISLASNRLQEFDHRIIEKTHQLTSLDLSGNKFMNWENAPLLKSKSLQVLDLHHSQISHLFTNTFSNLPHLTTIDLSDNLLITMDYGSFKRHRQLTSILLDGNPWNCDENTQKTLKLLKRKSVNATITGCIYKPKEKQKFQRMELKPTTTEAPPVTDTKIKQVWKNLDQICPLDSADKACDLFESCISNLSSLYKDVELQNKRYSEKLLNSSNRRMVSMTNVEVALYVGVFFGCFLGAGISYLGMLIFARCKRKQLDDHRLRRTYVIRNRERRATVDERHIAPSLPDVTPTIEPPWAHQVEPPQVPARRRDRRRRVTNHHQHQVVRSESFSFFGSLFDRPLRRRYMRSINQNATNLIRRLSQSRLFLNSSRSHDTTSTTAPVTSPVSVSSDTTRLIDGSSEMQSAQSFASVIDSSPTAPILIGSTTEISGANENIALTRSETPPPDYRDVVVVVKDN